MREVENKQSAQDFSFIFGDKYPLKITKKRQ